MSEERWHLNSHSEACNCGFHRENPGRISSIMLYYRFVFDPQTGMAKTSSSEEATTFNEMAAALEGEKLETGYVHPIEGGWRITDRSGKPISDRFVITQVLQSLDNLEKEVV